MTTPTTADEQLNINTVLRALQDAIASQALELAKAKAMLENRDGTIFAQKLVIEAYEAKYESDMEET